MIESIRLKFGRIPKEPTQAIPATPITVFVGPNNSGKSKVLREIEVVCRQGIYSATNVILDEVVFRGRSENEIENLIQHFTLPPLPEEVIDPDYVLLGKGQHRIQAPKVRLTSALRYPTENMGGFAIWYLRYNTLMLDGKSRITLAQPQVAGDLKSPATTSFQVLFRDNQKRAEVRRIIHEAFGSYLVMDALNLGQFRLALSDVAPASELLERGIHQAAVDFHSSTTPMDSASDGVKAFTGMICEIFAGDPHVVLIDEPEAFLHPSLAFKLGLEISIAAHATNKAIFVSTHSPNFVMGCIQSRVAVNIIRLTYRHKIATARVLRNEDILRLMRNPLLRSTGVLGALFYEFVVVTESDTDRAFYQEINERLSRFKPEWGVPNCLFLNAQNKQTVRTILGPLRELGIPAVGIVDIDVLKDGGQTWTSFLASGNVPQLEHQPLGTLRNSIKEKLEATGRNMKIDGGLDLLVGANREAAENLIDKLGEYGLFVLRGGELESWLKLLGAAGHGPNWLIDIFERMGEDPEAETYAKPVDGDVWEFMSKVKQWLVDPARKGIPA
jgi:ABC-type cobalamin/Fe3+-siderophores transport system ATPase subunit